MQTSSVAIIIISLEIQTKKRAIILAAAAIPIMKILKYFMVSRMQPKQF
jgi:hypothetical protein